jgi:electron transfer flavoprotein beta subunit
MKIVVCIKQTPDHEGPRESYAIDGETNRVKPVGISPVLSLFDENGLEAALKIKDQRDDVHITVVSVGKKISNAVMMKALAAGADELIKVEDQRFESHLLDSRETAKIIAETLGKLDQYDLILTGRQSSDWNNGFMGMALAKLLSIPCITYAQQVDIDTHGLIVNRIVDGGHEIIRSKLPAVVMVTNEIGELRYPAMKERRIAKKKPKHEWNGAEIHLDGATDCKLQLKRLYHPELIEKDCHFVEDSSLFEAGKNLAKVVIEKSILP